MSTKNALRVQKHRLLKGNETLKEKYMILRHKYGISSVLANAMKFWSVDKILDYISEHNIKPLKSLKEVDRL